MDRPQMLVFSEKSLNYSPFDVKWIPKSAKIVTLGSFPKGTGAIQIYEMNGSELELIQNTEKRHAIKCGTFNASSFEDRCLATGDFDGKLEIHDLIYPDKPIYSVKAHKEIINAIDGIGGLNIGKGAPEILTGSRDSMIKVWDPRQQDYPVICIEPKEGEQKHDCWSVAFGNSYSVDERVICAGFDNGDIKMIDLRAMNVMWERNLQNGVCSIEFDRRDIEMNKLVATTLEGKFHVFDLRTFHSERGYASLVEKRGNGTTWLVRHLPQNRELFAVTNGSGGIELCKYSYPDHRSEKLDDGTEVGVMGNMQLLQNILASSQPIVGFDWSPDKLGLCACTGLDESVRIIIVTKLNLC